MTVWVTVSSNFVLCDNVTCLKKGMNIFKITYFAHFIQVVFQQNGAAPHVANPVKQLLNNNLQGRWIGLGSNYLDWPTRSPD